jgi:methylase of polypeptide subunit release factors
VSGSADLIIANPPYLVDPQQRLYRHGGGELGFSLSLRIVTEGRECLAPGGRLVLYTGTPVIDGTDMFLEALTGRIAEHGFSFSYEEIDPDVFGEELDAPPYDRAERIAAVALVVDAPQ